MQAGVYRVICGQAKAFAAYRKGGSVVPADPIEGHECLPTMVGPGGSARLCTTLSWLSRPFLTVLDRPFLTAFDVPPNVAAALRIDRSVCLVLDPAERKKLATRSRRSFGKRVLDPGLLEESGRRSLAQDEELRGSAQPLPED